MSRLPTVLSTAVGATDVAPPVLLLELHARTGVTRLTTWPADIHWQGHVYQGNGDFGGVRAVEEGRALSPYQIDLYLSGAKASWMLGLQGTAYRHRDVHLYLGLLTEAHVLQDDTAARLWSGRMDRAIIITPEPEAQITLRCESYLAALDRTNGREFTSASHQERYPHDKFFEYALDHQDVLWGDVWISGGVHRRGGVRFRG